VSQRRVGLKGEKGGFYDENGDYMSVFTNDVVTVSNVDPEIRTKYFDPETGEWNYEAYNKEHGEEEASYLVSTNEIAHSTENAQFAQSLESLRIDKSKWYEAASTASEFFNRERPNVYVPVSTTFGVIARESAFDPNAVSNSGCMGLGQFGKAAWSDFLSQNTALAKRVLRAQGERLPIRKDKKLALRTNAILNIYATTWYLAKIAKRRGYKSVDSHNIKDVYLDYHEGAAGRKTLENYVNGKRGKLYDWQKSDPRGYWKTINRTGDQVAAQTAQYEREEALS